MNYLPQQLRFSNPNVYNRASQLFGEFYPNKPVGEAIALTRSILYSEFGINNCKEMLDPKAIAPTTEPRKVELSLPTASFTKQKEDPNSLFTQDELRYS